MADGMFQRFGTVDLSGSSGYYANSPELIVARPVHAGMRPESSRDPEQWSWEICVTIRYKFAFLSDGFVTLHLHSGTTIYIL